MDRQSISDAETGGHSKPANYWIPPNILLAPPHAAPMEDLDRANALMAEAGYEDGIEVEWLSPIPNYFSLGERVISQLRRIGITAKLQTMERGTYFDRLEEGATIQDRTSGWGDGNQILLIGTGTAGAFVTRFKAYVGWEAFASRMCVPEIDEVIAQYDASVNPAEREELAAKANAAVADGYYKIPIYWFSFIDAVGPRIAVMYLGKIVELAESQELCENPQHPYTKALFAAALPASPDEEQEEDTIAGEVPSALNIPPGCRFNPRCPFVMRHCSEEEPELKEVSPNHFVSCHLY